MSDKENTIKIYKDRKHKVAGIYGHNEMPYLYVCGPRTNNLWYRVLANEGGYVIAKVGLI